MSQRRSALILSAGHKKESLCVYIFNKICLFVLNLGDIVAVALVLLVRKTVLDFFFSTFGTSKIIFRCYLKLHF